MNCGFEDCIELDDALVAANDDWAAALPPFARERKVATDALADLALDNYIEMRDKTIDPFFVLKSKLDGLIHGCVGAICATQAACAPASPSGLRRASDPTVIPTREA